MEAERIADQVERAWGGDAWHGPSLRELLSDVSAEEAVARPVAGAHTIWELVLHINAWEKAAAELIDGGPGKLTDAEDWPPVEDTGAAAWKDALTALERDNAALRSRILQLGDEDLGRKLEGRDYEAYVLLHGVVQHDLYHAGQIALLKRVMAERA